MASTEQRPAFRFGWPSLRPERPGPSESEEPTEAQTAIRTDAWIGSGPSTDPDEPGNRPDARGEEAAAAATDAAGPTAATATDGDQAAAATAPRGEERAATETYGDRTPTPAAPAGHPAAAPRSGANGDEQAEPRTATTAGYRPHTGGAGERGENGAAPGRPGSAPLAGNALPGSPAANVPAADHAEHGAQTPPNQFLAELLAAMRSAAEQSRRSTMVALHASAGAHVEALRTRSSETESELRRRAEQDIGAIREWSKAEVARILQETEARVAGRDRELEQHLRDHQALVAQQVERIQARIASYEHEIEAFFRRLGELDDPAAFATLARAMPEPPALDHAADTASVAPSEAGNRDGTVGSNHGSSGEFPSARLAGGLVPSSEPPATAPSSAPPKAATEVIVTGLVSVAAIASFKRQLARVPGVEAVGVSSGSEGEFVFRTTHEPGVALGEVIPALPGFAAQVVEAREGTLRVSAQDPESAA